MWAWLYAVFPRFAHGDLRRVFDGAVCDCGGAVVFGNVVQHLFFDDRAERELHAAFEYFANVYARGIFERHPAGQVFDFHRRRSAAQTDGNVGRRGQAVVGRRNAATHFATLPVHHYGVGGAAGDSGDYPVSAL